MPQATGLQARRGYNIDRDAVLLGNVRRGDNVAAETRTGAARILDNKLNTCDLVKVVAQGALSNAAGGYFVDVAHVAIGGSLPASDSTNWIRVGSIVLDGLNAVELPLSGVELNRRVKGETSPAISGEVRVVAIRLVAGTGTGAGQNGLAVPANTTGSYVFYQLPV